MVTATDAPGCQVMRQLARPFIELPVRAAPITDDEREAVRDGVDGMLDQVGDVPGDAATLNASAPLCQPGQRAGDPRACEREHERP